MSESISLTVAFAAGVLSFASPCVLPLIPGYIGYMSGVSGSGGDRKAILGAPTHALAFVLGFGIVFTLFGIGVGILGQVIGEWQPILKRIGGAVIVLMALHIMGILRIPVLYREASLQPKIPVGLGYVSSFALGLFFALGWTPCIGPVLTSILIVAASGQSPATATLLLATYSLGLGLPFVLTGIFFTKATEALRRLRSLGAAVNYASGALLMVMGLLLLTGNLEKLLRILPTWQLPL
jgi:cytochrome c-type biogenesis protein